jgi:hypothetical protein
MMSQAGYAWMTGGAGAPGWMRGGTLPGFMMGGSAGTNPGTVMGTLFAGAPGPRVSTADALRLGTQVPAGATVNSAARIVTFTTSTVDLAVLASPDARRVVPHRRDDQPGDQRPRRGAHHHRAGQRRR